MNSELQNQWYYKIAYFFIANQVLFKRLAVVLLLLIDIGFFWFSGVGLVNYFADTKNYQKILSELSKADNAIRQYRETHKPLDLEIISINKISLGNNKYDLVAKISNPNERWVNNIEYGFVVDGLALDTWSTFVLPLQEKYLFNFNYYSLNYPNNVELKIRTNHWQKVDSENQILQEIIVGEQEFQSERGHSEIKFSVENLSHFNFWQVGWQVVAYGGSYPMAVNYVTADSLLSGQKREISTAWNYDFSQPTKIEIVPDINVYDSNIFFRTNDLPVNLIKGIHDEK